MIHLNLVTSIFAKYFTELKLFASQPGNTLRKIEDCDPKIQSQSSQKIEDCDRFRSPRLKIEDCEKAIAVLIAVLVAVLIAVLIVVLDF